MNVKPEIRYGSFARFLLVGNACNRKDARMLLKERERRCLSFLYMWLAVDFVSNIEHQSSYSKVNGEKTHVIVHGGIPSSWNCVTSPTHTSSRFSMGIMAAVSAISTQIDLRR